MLTLRRFLTFVSILLMIIWSIFPVMQMVLTSLKPERIAFAVPPVWVFKPTFESYASVLQSADFIPYFWNTLIIALTTSALSTGFGALSAYSFARFKFKGITVLPLFYLVIRMIPRAVFVLPYYIIVSKLGLLNTRSALIASYVTFALPFAIWMMIGFFKEIPTELEEAGMVDGCNRLMVFLKVVLPLVAPGLAATAIFSFLLGWNEFLYSLILGGPDSRTLPVIIAGFDTDRGVMWGPMTAGATLIMLPALIFGLLTQKHIVRGLTSGAVKG